jgi:hypothetical protein
MPHGKADQRRADRVVVDRVPEALKAVGPAAAGKLTVVHRAVVDKARAQAPLLQSHKADTAAARLRAASLRVAGITSTKTTRARTDLPYRWRLISD